MSLALLQARRRTHLRRRLCGRDATLVVSCRSTRADSWAGHQRLVAHTSLSHATRAARRTDVDPELAGLKGALYKRKDFLDVEEEGA